MANSAVLNSQFSASWQQGWLQVTSAFAVRQHSVASRCIPSNSKERRLLDVSQHLQWSVTPRNREVLRLPLRSMCTVVVDFLLLLQAQEQGG
jgi:hypothetical protein